MRIALVVTALVLAACAGGTATTTSDVPTTATTMTSSEAPTTVPATDSTGTTTQGETPPSTRPAPNPDRPLAPDFSLTLSDGTVYDYASEVRPVFMVFWAEW